MIHLSFLYHVYVSNHACVCYISVCAFHFYVICMCRINYVCAMSSHEYQCHVYVCHCSYINDSCVHLPRIINMSGITLSFLSLTSFSLSLSLFLALSLPHFRPPPPPPSLSPRCLSPSRTLSLYLRSNSSSALSRLRHRGKGHPRGRVRKESLTGS